VLIASLKDESCPDRFVLNCDFVVTRPVSTSFLEAQINQNPLIDAALIFGNGRRHPGVLIQLKSEFQANLLDDEKISQVLDVLR
jgi:hypothetical protein